MKYTNHTDEQLVKLLRQDLIREFGDPGLLFNMLSVEADDLDTIRTLLNTIEDADEVTSRSAKMRRWNSLCQEWVALILQGDHPAYQELNRQFKDANANRTSEPLTGIPVVLQNFGRQR